MYDLEYVTLLHHVVSPANTNRFDIIDRTGVGTYRDNTQIMKFDLREQFIPIITLKKINIKAVINEFIWMVVLGSTDVGWLQERGHSFWNAWTDENNNIGRGYGRQFRRMEYIDDNGEVKTYDQVAEVIKSIKEDPYSRRHVISLWNAPEMNMTTLPCCHGTVIQFFVNSDGTLDMTMYQRSGDIFVGVPWNITFYSLFLHVVAKICNKKARYFKHIIGDAHVYKNHMNGYLELRKRINNNKFNNSDSIIPQIVFKKDLSSIDEFDENTVEIKNYNCLPAIKVDVAV